MLVQGPYLVRSASITSNNTLQLTGDVDGSTQAITIFTPSITTVTWNGKQLAITKDGNMITATLDGPEDFSLPALGPWKWQDTLPEIKSNYTVSDNVWISKCSHCLLKSQNTH